MSIGEICVRDTVVAARHSPIAEIARRMREEHVGSVVILDDDARTPAGVVTDRDLVVELLAEGVDLDTVTAGDVMSTELLLVRESDPVFETIQRMRQRGVRRVPVVDAQNALIGIVSMDDLVEFLVEELSDLVRVVRRERMHESQLRETG